MADLTTSDPETDMIQSIVLLNFQADYGAPGDAPEDNRYLEGEIDVSDFVGDGELSFVRYVLRCGKSGTKTLPAINIEATYGTLQPKQFDRELLDIQIKRYGAHFLWPQFAALYGAVSYQMRLDFPQLPVAINDMGWKISVIEDAADD